MSQQFRKIILIFCSLFCLTCNSKVNVNTTLRYHQLTPTPTNSPTATPTATPIATATVTPTALLIFSEGATYDFGASLKNIVFEKTMTISNSGAAEAKSLSASLPAPFSFKGGVYPGTSGTCGTSLAAGSSCTVTLSYTSTNVTSAQENLVLRYQNNVSTVEATIALKAKTFEYSQTQRFAGSGNNGRNASDRYGLKMDLSADTLVISADLQDYDAAGANFLANAGAVYVYIKTGTSWTLQQKLVGVGTNGRIANDGFGNAVSLSGDTIAVGAPFQDYDETGANLLADAGAVYVFTRTLGVWTLQQKIVGSGTNSRNAGDFFGNHVVVSGDDLLVGAPRNDYDEDGANALSDTGIIFVFKRVLGAWSLQQRIAAGGISARNANDIFGWRFAFKENILAVSSYSHQYDENGLNAIANAGAVWVYKYNGSTWAYQQKLVANLRVAQDVFGASLDISGTTIAIGAHGHGYDANGANLVSGSGAVFVYKETNSVWNFEAKLVAQGTNSRLASDKFGSGLAFAGETLLISAINNGYDADGANFVSQAGAIYAFQRSGPTWQFSKKLVVSGTNARVASDQIGENNIISFGDTFIVGSYLQDYDATGANFLSGSGAAFMFNN